MPGFTRGFRQEIDCADLAVVGLVRFAAAWHLPVRLFDFEERPRRWFDFEPGATDADAYIARATQQLGAVNLIDNTRRVRVRELRPGDLILSERRTADSTGHTRIVTGVAYDRQRDDWLIDWMQGNLPASIPEARRFYFREIPNPHNLRMQPRRWRFDQFTRS
jgi:hypothetical protein